MSERLKDVGEYFEGAVVTKRKPLSIQVCTPEGWSDDLVKAFADKDTECGTELGWVIRKEGDKDLKGDPERNPCSERKGFVHITLDA